ncbi:MAG: small multi-drug export protein [Candidatus Altiarchaeota archaeon]|nr:small multi-drug export protein [Candidatus Altiarchaeota archaeon]
MDLLSWLHGVLGGNDWLYTIVISMLPWIELRGSIPYGILKAGFEPLTVFFVAFFSNIVVIYPSFVFLDYFFELLNKTPLRRFIEKTQKKAKPYVDRYGMLGLCFFVAVPLPGTGAYSGALAAHIFGLKNKKAFMSIIAGVFLAAVAVTVITLFFRESLGFLIKNLP